MSQNKNKTTESVRTKRIVKWLKYYAKRIRQKFCEHKLEYKTKPCKEAGSKTSTSCRCKKCGRVFWLCVIVPHDYLIEGEHWEANTLTDLYMQKAT